MADTRSYEADVARVLRDYYAPELRSDDVAKVAAVAARVAAEVLTGATFYARSGHIDDIDEDTRLDLHKEAWEEGRGAGWADGNHSLEYLRDELRETIDGNDPDGLAELMADDARWVVEP